jgi:hypothetical protein
MKLQSLLIPAVISLLILFSCKKSDIASGIPACIRKEISAHKNDPDWTVSNVHEYIFQNRLVYGFDHGLIADGQLEIKDGSCNIICNVGGFGGPAVNICNGENFFQAAVLKRIIWEKK